ncbi:hypothetical protein FRB94_010362 [Tulasnella sp. JGI-2019a]|nr:hypothetical protein FRB93_010034 [Tulasnella sp. JGI-2019a]KAG8993804.1 hypothetical protein FRB94_010362 [Tulasnella sp. JGI-2019a]
MKDYSPLFYQGLLAVSECPGHRRIASAATPSTKPRPSQQQGRSFLSFHTSVSTKESSQKSSLPSYKQVVPSLPSPTKPTSPTQRALPLPKPAPSSSLPAIPNALLLRPNSPIVIAQPASAPATSTSYSSAQAGPSTSSAAGASRVQSAAPSSSLASTNGSQRKSPPSPYQVQFQNATRRHMSIFSPNLYLNMPSTSTSTRNNHGHSAEPSPSPITPGSAPANVMSSSPSVRSIGSTAVSTQYKKRKRHNALLALEGRTGRTRGSSRIVGGDNSNASRRRSQTGYPGALGGGSFVPSILQEGDEDDNLLGVDVLQSHLSFTSWYTNGTSGHHVLPEEASDWMTLPSFAHPGAMMRSASAPMSLPVSYATTSSSGGLFVEPSVPRRKSTGTTSGGASVEWGMNFMDLDDDSSSSYIRYSIIA